MENVDKNVHPGAAYPLPPVSMVTIAREDAEDGAKYNTLQSSDSSHSTELDHDYLSHQCDVIKPPQGGIASSLATPDVRVPGCGDVTTTLRATIKTPINKGNVTQNYCDRRDTSSLPGLTFGGNPKLECLRWQDDVTATTTPTHVQAPVCTSPAAAITLPNPVLIQSGLQKTLCLASFRPVSPLSEAGDEGPHVHGPHAQEEEEEEEEEMMEQWWQTRAASSSSSAPAHQHSVRHLVKPTVTYTQPPGHTSQPAGLRQQEGEDGEVKAAPSADNGGKQRQENVAGSGELVPMKQTPVTTKAGENGDGNKLGDHIGVNANNSAINSPTAGPKAKEKAAKQRSDAKTPKTPSRGNDKTSDKTEQNSQKVTPRRRSSTKSKKSSEQTKKASVSKKSVKTSDSESSDSSDESEADKYKASTSKKSPGSARKTKEKNLMKVKIPSNKLLKSKKGRASPKMKKKKSKKSSARETGAGADDNTDNEATADVTSSKSSIKSSGSSTRDAGSSSANSSRSSTRDGSSSPALSECARRAAAKQEEAEVRRLHSLTGEIYSATLAKWEQYLCMPPARVLLLEEQAARGSHYTEEALDLVTNADLHVRQILDNLIPAFNPRDLELGNFRTDH